MHISPPVASAAVRSKAVILLLLTFCLLLLPLWGVCNCSMFCSTLFYVQSSIAIILIGKGGLVALLNVSSWCLVMVGWIFLAVPWGCLWFVIVVVPDHTHLLFLTYVYWPNLRPRFCCCINTKYVQLAWRLDNLCNGSLQGNNRIN